MKTIYLDNNATTCIDPIVLDKMMPFLKDRYGNPSSMHDFGGTVMHDVDRAREQIAGLINADPREILFTSCGTESDNTALLSALESYPDKRHIITTRVEHSAILNMCKHLSKKGYSITYLPVDHEGMIDLRQLEEAITPDTALVSIMYANNETGVVYPIDKIAQIVKERSVLFHTDAVQAVGKLPLDLKELPVDMLSLSGHKLHAPKGVGVLYIRRGTRFQPYIIGGHQEHGRRGGTENVASIVGLGYACEIAQKHMDYENTEVKRLRDKLENALLSIVPNSILNGHREMRLPNTTNISFEYVEGEGILLLLNEKGVCASSGSACTSGSIEPSHVLRAMGVPFTAAHGSIRFSLSRYTTEAEIDFVIKTVPPVIDRLREISPFWGKDNLAVR
ncbi:MAG: cysteine desulfurase NifS [Candidatus Auribacter fodinae]|jgi:cysteine desulfurase|uniref:Cysteine desulfurase n=1 Tax=Candidatus Auribacter fodinae TaxID=2093366 RepID=A0A3A4R7W4_9BACT|nr:MAG: cysteine desulfurase NifS [Candidatus Auribacter fodinae]